MAGLYQVRMPVMTTLFISAHCPFLQPWSRWFSRLVITSRGLNQGKRWMGGCSIYNLQTKNPKFRTMLLVAHLLGMAINALRACFTCFLMYINYFSTVGFLA